MTLLITTVKNTNKKKSVTLKINSIKQKFYNFQVLLEKINIV